MNQFQQDLQLARALIGPHPSHHDSRQLAHLTFGKAPKCASLVQSHQLRRTPSYWQSFRSTTSHPTTSLSPNRQTIGVPIRAQSQLRQLAYAAMVYYLDQLLSKLHGKSPSPSFPWPQLKNQARPIAMSVAMDMAFGRSLHKIQLIV